MDISKNINDIDKNTMVILAVNACNFLESLYLKDAKNQYVFLKNNVDDYDKYINVFITILNKITIDSDFMKEILEAIKEKNEAVFPELESTLIYYYEDEINFDDDNILKFCLKPFDLSKIN